ncbi:hypothetical protein V6N13_092459 [Hibiscus sabdariffa]|uniref:Uncharacterized protein n=1 Tax=Hibiscus sabdariffa TaxID=183260 RepID=A0ABR2CCF9_9ROSI
MNAADDAETKHVMFVVEDLEPFGAEGGGETRYHVDFTEAAHVAVADDDVTALEEVFVRLGVIETANHRPDGFHGGVNGLNHGGATLVRTKIVNMVSRDHVGGGDTGGEREKVSEGGGLGLSLVVAAADGGGCAVELQRGRHFWWWVNQTEGEKCEIGMKKMV